MPGPAPTPRLLWTLFEPIHALTYFAPEAKAAFTEAGLRGFWRGYFAGRAAPLGAADAAPVAAAFFGFAPAMVARALPDVWTRITPADALAARTRGAVAALRRLTAATGPDTADDRAAEDRPVEEPAAGERVAEAAGLLTAAVDRLDVSGRVLAAANAALPRPDEPFARLWHAATVLREHRGDGHNAALVAAGLDGAAVLVWRAATDIPAEELRDNRGWTDEQWAAATGRLVRDGWLTPDGRPTPGGRSRFAAIEEATDRAAAGPWRDAPADEVARLCALLRPLARACHGALRHPNPIGLPAPDGTAPDRAAPPTAAAGAPAG